MLEQVPPLESGTGSLNNPLTTLKNMMNASPSALDHSNEGDEPGSAFIKSNEQKILSGLSPLHANIVKRNNNNAGTVGGMGGMYLNHNVAFTGTIGKHNWDGESPMDGAGRTVTNQMLPMDDKGSSSGAKDPLNGRSKNDNLT
jgi:hypothetical protein